MDTVLWILQIILCIKFISVAFTHLFRRDKPEMQQAMRRYGPPAPLLLTLAGLGAFLGGLCLALPVVFPGLAWLAPWAAALLAGLSLLSIVLHLKARESPKIWVSLVLFSLAALVASGRWFLE